jgi:hypothetical protein
MKNFQKNQIKLTSTLLIHTKSSSSSSDMEDQITMALSGIMEEAMSILIGEEAGSSSAPWRKCHRCYISRDHESAHLRLHHE